MKVLVTGGAGFIGSHVADAYLEHGLEVVIADDLSRGRLENVSAQSKFYQVDIRNREALEKIFASERPDVVNHHAAQMDVRLGVREPVYDAEVNILGSIHLLNCAVRHNVKRFIYASTAGAAYGEPNGLPVSEEHPINPITPYGITKHTVEHYLFTYYSLYHLPYVVLRYGNVYGPRQSSQGEAGVVAIFCEQMLQNIVPKLYGDGSKTRDYVYVSDIAQANVLALGRGEQEIFGLGSGVPTTDYEIFTAIHAALCLRPFEPEFVTKRPGEIDHIHLDIRKAREKLHWEPKVALREGIQKAVEYFAARFARPIENLGERSSSARRASGGGVLHPAKPARRS